MLTFAMSLMILLVLNCSTKVSEKSDLISVRGDGYMVHFEEVVPHTAFFEAEYVVLIFTAVKKLKPCGSNFSPIFYILFRFY